MFQKYLCILCVYINEDNVYKMNRALDFIDRGN